jgi:hypothetical protein
VHGLSVPLGKAGYRLPRTISIALTTNSASEPDPIPAEDRTVDRNRDLSSTVAANVRHPEE